MKNPPATGRRAIRPRAVDPSLPTSHFSIAIPRNTAQLEVARGGTGFLSGIVGLLLGATVPGVLVVLVVAAEQRGQQQGLAVPTARAGFVSSVGAGGMSFSPRGPPMYTEEFRLSGLLSPRVGRPVHNQVVLKASPPNTPKRPNAQRVLVSPRLPTLDGRKVRGACAAAIRRSVHACRRGRACPEGSRETLATAAGSAPQGFAP